MLLNKTLSHRLPDFIILGAPKSATTWFHHALRDHPQVFMPKPEVSFFEDPDYGQATLHDLSALFRNASQDQILGIKRPSYLSKGNCAERIAHDVPHAKLVIALRNPVERAVSDFHHMIRMGLMPVTEPDAGLNALLDDYNGIPDRLGILHYGLYAGAMERYFGLFPERQRCVVLQYDVSENPRESYRKVCDFLGIDRDFLAPNIDGRTNVGIYGLRLLQSMHTLNHARFIINPKQGRLYTRTGTLGGAIDFAFAVAQRALLSMSPLPQQKDAHVSQATMSRLLDFYLPDIERLEALTGMDLSRWKTLP
jgi:Sulfotransferase domain